MKWRKHGIVYAPGGSVSWARSHAMIPTPVLLSPTLLRVYCTFCDEHMVGRPGFVDLNPDNPMQVLNVSKAPLFDIGRPGTFDENGILPCAVVPVGHQYYMYYVGFELGTKIRYRLLTGLAVSDDGGHTFSKIRQTPVLERSDAELYFRCGPFALWQDDHMRLWYIAGSEWTEVNGKQMPVYVMKYQESADGRIWADEGRLSLALEDEDEHGFGRPWVVRRGARDYQLYFSVRKRSVAAYRLGYAESTNGIDWVRKDHEMGLDVSPGGFDSDAIMYAAVITIGNKTWCFYNGNDFGRDGFALAELIPLADELVGSAGARGISL